MISFPELTAIGFISKTNGIKGELTLQLDTEYDPKDFRFLIFEIENIFVPFSLASSRGNSVNNRIISLEGVEDIEDAKDFAGKTAYVLKSELESNPLYKEMNPENEETLYLSDLVGFQIFNSNKKSIGEIVGYNDDTQNFLLEVESSKGETFYVPYIEEWLIDFDVNNKTISFDLPEGLIE